MVIIIIVNNYAFHVVTLILYKHFTIINIAQIININQIKYNTFKVNYIGFMNCLDTYFGNLNILAPSFTNINQTYYVSLHIIYVYYGLAKIANIILKV